MHHWDDGVFVRQVHVYDAGTSGDVGCDSILKSSKKFVSLQVDRRGAIGAFLKEELTMNNEILYVLLPDFAEHEMVYLAQAVASDEYALKENPKYVNKIVTPTMEPVKSIGGFRMLPDYSFDTMPEDYAALVLIGGFGWTTPIADKVVSIVKHAIENGKIVGAICNASSFMAKHGFLNNIKHTGNGIEQLSSWGGENYTNPDGYVNAQAVSDANIVTANGSATLEFAKELLLLLENDTPERIEMYYQFNKQGFCELFK